MLNQYWAENLNPADPLIKMRQNGWSLFEEIGLPHPKQEAFQYLRAKLQFPRPAVRKTLTGAKREGLVFVDGFFEESLSQIPSSFVCLPLDQAIRSYGIFLQSRLNKLFVEEQDPFGALNAAFQGRAVFLYIPPKCKAALHLTHLFVSDEMITPRVHIYVGRNAELELFQSSSGQARFCNQYLDFALDEGASVHFQDTTDGTFQTFRATLKKDSRLKALFLGQHLRSSLKIQLTEENSEAEALGLSCLSQSQESHIHALLEHLAPHTRSRQHFKSVVKDQSRFSFEGKIYVHAVAQKTESYQLNNNLILGTSASANAKPNLEIFADDVKASHGSTVGQLDEEQLFYLRSRGLSEEAARQFLIDGFCKEITDHAR